MNEFFEGRNYDGSVYYQIDIYMSESTLTTNAERLSEIICQYCHLPEWYGIKNVKARLLLCFEQEKAVTIDCNDNFGVYSELFNLLKDYCPTFSRDNYFKRKAATYFLKEMIKCLIILDKLWSN